MRTNVPTALFQTWVDVRMRLGLVAVASVVMPGADFRECRPDLIDESWVDIAPHTPPATAAAIRDFVGDSMSLRSNLAGSPADPGGGTGRRSGMPFRVSCHETEGDRRGGCDRIFEADSDGVVNDVLVVPWLATEDTEPARVLIFFSGIVLDPDEVRFLHTAAGLFFVQQALWNNGRRREPAVALKPREIECVRWAVTGRTLAEIAGIMRLAYRTVRFHLDSARARYGFSTNQQLFVQAAKDYGLDPENTPGTIRRERTVVALPPLRRMQPLWDERRATFDRRVDDRRQVIILPLPFADRRAKRDRRAGAERRAVAQSTGPSAETLLTPEEIRALLH